MNPANEEARILCAVNLRLLRAMLNLSQRDIAKKLGADRVTVLALENETRKTNIRLIEEVQNLVNFLGVKVESGDNEWKINIPKELFCADKLDDFFNGYVSTLETKPLRQNNVAQ
jgi:transcriptional regulator with XRE-family HTH domain